MSAEGLQKREGDALVEEAMALLRRGKLVVVADDRDRENEGDLVLAAERVTPAGIQFMIEHGQGLICLSLTEERLQYLQIPMQVSENQSPLGTGFAVSFDHLSVVGRGGTASGRAETIARAVSDEVSPREFVKPGSVFPLRAMNGGVLRRRGQTEASVDLARLAGLHPAGVICECMGADGTMLSGVSLEEYCRRHSLLLLTVEDIVQYRLRRDISVRRTAEVNLLRREARTEGLLGILEEIATGIDVRVLIYLDDADDREHLAICIGEPKSGALARIHSECLTGDVFGSRRCDCGEQLHGALSAMVAAGSGVLIYLHQEGRGIGLSNKLRAYELQDRGLDTVEANVALGFQPDERNFRVGAKILRDLGVTAVRLMTNNPEKLEALRANGVEVLERVPSISPVDSHNARYLETKRTRLGHLLPR